MENQVTSCKGGGLHYRYISFQSSMHGGYRVYSVGNSDLSNEDKKKLLEEWYPTEEDLVSTVDKMLACNAVKFISK